MKTEFLNETDVGSSTADWKVCAIADVCQVVAGFGFPLKYQNLVLTGIPFIKVSDMNHPENQKYIVKYSFFVDDEILKQIQAKAYPANTIIFPKIGAALLTNKRRILSEEACFDNNIMGLIPKSSTDAEFLYYLTLMIKLDKYSQATSLPSVTKTQIELLRIPLPDLHEQQEIASILSKIDDLIQKIDEIIEQTQRLKKDLTNRLLIQGVSHKKFKSINLIHRNINFLIPELWEIKTIDELSAEIKDGPMGFQLHNYDYVEKGIPVIRVQNLKDLSVTKGDLCYISEAKHNELKKSQVKPNDIIISKTGIRLGVVGIVPLNYGRANLNQALARISLKDNGISQYVATYLSSQIPQQILSVVGSGRTAQPGLRMSDIKELQIPIPPKEERDRIMSFLQGVDRKLRNNQMYKANLYILKKGLMQNLLTGKIRVKV